MCLVYFLGIAAYLEMPANVALHPLGRARSKAEREGPVGCKRVLGATRYRWNPQMDSWTENQEEWL